MAKTCVLGALGNVNENSPVALICFYICNIGQIDLIIKKELSLRNLTIQPITDATIHLSPYCFCIQL